MATFQSLPGFREFYPEDCAARNGLFQAWRGAARRQGFVEYDAPVLEPLELFTEKSGEEIRSQLFEFEDKGGRKVALRPEMTPTLARLVAARAGSLRKPVKWFSIGEQFRYEKPQKGRLRSFYQFNADILGEPGPGADAECIALLVESLKACGLKEGEFEIRVSDRKLWFLFLKSFVSDDERVIKVLAIVDKWDREPKEEVKKKLGQYINPQIDIESVWKAISDLRQNPAMWIAEIQAVDMDPDLLNALKARGLEIEDLNNRLKNLGLEKFCRFDYSIVRGLAYYTGFVFEAFQTVGTARALAGGGRYDDLIQKLGGVEMPAVGFAIGDVTVTDLLQELKRPLGEVEKPDVYIVIVNENERSAALKLAGMLRRGDSNCGVKALSVDYPLKGEKFDKQLKAASQMHAKIAIIFGLDEVEKGEVKIKDLNSRGQTGPLANGSGLMAKIHEILASGVPATGV